MSTHTRRGLCGLACITAMTVLSFIPATTSASPLSAPDRAGQQQVSGSEPEAPAVEASGQNDSDTSQPILAVFTQLRTEPVGLLLLATSLLTTAMAAAHMRRRPHSRRRLTNY